MDMDTTTRKTVQYEIRTVDQHGDVIDNPWFEDGPGAKARILKTWATLTPEGEGCAALWLERVTVWGCESEGVEDAIYEMLETKG